MFKVYIVTKEMTLFDGTASSVVLPGEDGQFNILPFHAPIVFKLTEGEIRVDDKLFNISDGIMRFEDNELHAIVELP